MCYGQILAAAPVTAAGPRLTAGRDRSLLQHCQHHGRLGCTLLVERVVGVGGVAEWRASGLGARLANIYCCVPGILETETGQCSVVYCSVMLYVE